MSLGDSLIQIVKDRLPDLFLRGVFKFRVVKRSDDGIDLQPVRARWLKTIPLPDQWPGMAGMFCDPKGGTEVLIAFIDADETQPVIVNWAPLSSVRPKTLSLDADEIKVGEGAGAVLRDGDTVGLTFASPGPGTTIITLVSGTAQTPAAASRLKA